MDQPLLAEKAQNEADTDDLDVSSQPGSPTPHHRPGHSGVNHHHGYHHHGVSHHHGESHHHDISHHHSESHQHGGSQHHSITHHHGESHHHVGSHHHGTSHHHGESHHHVGSHHHGTSHHHGESHHHGISHHHGGSHHLGEFQDFHDDAPSHHSPHFHHSHHPHHSHHHDEAHHHGRAHNLTTLALTPSYSPILSHSLGEGPFDGEYHHGSRRHHDRPHHHGEPYHHEGPHHHGEPYHHEGPHHRGEPYHHDGSHHRREPHHHGGSHHPNEVSHHSGLHHQGEPSYTYGGPHHHGEAYHHGRHHHHEAHHHRGPLHHGETFSRHSYVDSYHDYIPHYYDDHSHHSEHHHGHRGEHHHGHHGHHGEHHHGHHGEHRHREHHHNGHHYDYFHGDHRYGEYYHGSSQGLGLYKSHSVARASLGSSRSRSVALQPSMVQVQHSAFSVTRTRSAVHSHATQASSKVHPQHSSSKTSSESWAEEDEQFQKRKTARAQRAHKRLHTMDLFYWLWEKLSYLIQGLRRMLRNLTQSLPFEAFIFLVVCLNTLMLVVQTFAEVEIRGEWYFMALDSIFLCIYVVEAVLKITALGFKYFSDPWNNLDFFIMIMAMLDFLLLQYNSFSFVYHQSVFRIFKVFKSLRALRAIRVLRRLRSAGPWLGVVRAREDLTAQTAPSLPGAWYIIPILMIYIIIQYFIFLNLVIAVLVDNFQMARLKTRASSSQRAARIHEKLLDDSLTELSKSDPEEVVSEHTKQKQLIEKKFGTMTEKQQELLFHFLQLVAGVEHHQQKFRSQASVLDEIVDTAFEVGRAGPEARGQSRRTPEGQAWEAHAQRAPNSHVGVWEGRGWHWLSRPPIPPPQAGEEDFRK
uniref:Cation channel sperm associated 1 n=1 Tax=Ursus maritimus TaxID=29073 RepID=A0A452U2H0_URSMA